MIMRKVLFITNLLPYPLDNGGKIKSYNIISALSKLYEIDLICFANSKSDLKYSDSLKDITNDTKIVVKTIVRSSSKLSFIKEYLKSLFSFLPYSINKFWNKEFENHIVDYLNKNSYDFIYVDHLPMMIYYKLFKSKKIILDQHNVENLIFKRIVDVEKKGIKRFVLNYEYLKLRKFEMFSMNKVSHIISLSEEDKKEFVNLGISPDKLSVLPIHIEVSKKYNVKEITEGKIRLLFLGSMSWYPNQNGLKWFMEEVWNKLDKDIYEIYIVGSNPPNLITNYHNDKNVFVTGYVDNVDKYIELCDISIVPLFIGSGQRVKIIESFAKGIPVISTGIGAEGLIWENGKDLLIANTAQEFIEQLDYIKEQPGILSNISLNAMARYRNNYSSDKLPEKIKHIVREIES
ncbi:glycosyltransferase [Mycobacteroides abscessus subsp. abscessus]|nr:glycosyltransferase [Mycobacteroides abscessus subsp. abscessus]